MAGQPDDMAGGNSQPVTLAGLLAGSDWPRIKASLAWLYPDCREYVDDFGLVLQTLRGLRPVPCSLRINIRISSGAHPAEPKHHEVIGRHRFCGALATSFMQRGETLTVQPGEDVCFVISAEPWAKWLGMQIESDLLQQMPREHLIAHCLWEMTEFGFTEDEIRNTLNACGFDTRES